MSQAQLSRLLPLPDDELKQVLEYASTLSKSEAADHFTNLLGESPQVVDFISSFNGRRADPKPQASSAAPSSGPASEVEGVPKPNHKHKKKKAQNLHTPPPRQVATFDVAPGAVYNKKDQVGEYISRKPGAPATSNAQPAPSRAPQLKSATPPPQSSKLPPSALGALVSDLGLKPKPRSNPTSRSSTPGPASRNNVNNTKVSITGGVPMQGASTALSDLDQAIRSLEITTNPTHASNSAAGIASRRCNCVGAQHPLLDAAPNCLNCGKVICIKEGLGPCTFCGEPLLSSAEVQDMIKELRAERGREKMAADREAHKKADVGRTPRPFTKPRGDPTSAAESKALEHRDRLLNFQAQNAQRTTIRDEVADFDVSVGGSMWASPEERALALKKQQKLLRDMEWNALPEYEKRQQVVSIDLSGKKIFKKMVKKERPPSPEDVSASSGSTALRQIDGNKGQGGAFSENPLLNGLIRPVYENSGDGKLEGRKDHDKRWRKVQDDLEL